MTESFVPYGCLGQSYSSYQLAGILLSNIEKGWESYQNCLKGKKEKYYNRLNRYLVWKLYPLAMKYGKKKKKIDKKYVKEVGKIIKELIKTIREIKNLP